jgi:CheY-like chemotaxis protein
VDQPVWSEDDHTLRFVRVSALLRLRHLRILVVDDDKDSADSMAMLLRIDGHDAVIAYTGSDALRISGDWQPHVILLDIGMPVMDGFEVARKLRERSASPAVTLIAVTGYTAHSASDRSKELGFDHYLFKPVDPNQLRNILVASLGGVHGTLSD